MSSRRLLAGCLLALSCAGLTGPSRNALAADAQPAPSGALRVAYRVVVDAPKEVKQPVEASLDLVRWQSYADMTEDLLDRLIVDGVDQAKQAAAAVGYFSAHVDIAVERDSSGSGKPLTLRVMVEPGVPTRIASVHVNVTGPAERDPAGEAAIAKARSEWLLPVGDVFTQAQWTAAKTRAVATIAASPFASAHIDASEARIDPAAARAELEMTIASGPPFRFGSLDIDGLSRYDRSLVENFSTIEKGEPYDEAKLDQFIRRLNSSGYFASVQAAIDRDPSRAQSADVKMSVIEAPRHRFEFGIAYTTDTAIRGNVRYSDVDLDGKGLQWVVDARVDSNIQNVETRFTRPPDAAGWINGLRASSERTDIENLTTHTDALGVTRSSLDERNRTVYSGTLYHDSQFVQNEPPEHSHALYGAIERTWRDVDDLLVPTSGYMVDLEVGGAPPGVSSRGFVRTVVKSQAWFPFGRDDNVSLRGEAGAVGAGSRDGVPSVLLFRTGGDTTVRGYAFESLGVQRGDAVVGGRYYALASAEATHYFTPVLGAAVFVDAGNAKDRLSDLRPALGYGVGARVRTPIGPLRIDVAYGQDTHAVRLHMSVGLRF